MMSGWLKQPGECFDSRGVPIYPGDLLRSLHFIGARCKRYYLYHVAVMDAEAGGLRIVPTKHLDPSKRTDPETRGGNPLLSDGLAASSTIIDGCGPDRQWFEDRPRQSIDKSRQKPEGGE